MARWNTWGVIFRGLVIIITLYITILVGKLSIIRLNAVSTDIGQLTTMTTRAPQALTTPSYSDIKPHYLIYPRDRKGWRRNGSLPGLDATELTKSVNELMAKCEKFTISSASNMTSPFCDCQPATLVGRFNGSFEVNSLEELLRKYSDIARGGHWAPLNCTARERVAIIIPFKKRDEHLRALLNVLHPLLHRQQLDYRIFVAEQVIPNVFNKAATMNTAFIVANSMHHFDCVFFHDVDMLPQDDRNIYTCSGASPRHAGAFIDKMNYSIKFGAVFGGVTAFTPLHFRLINGFSNRFYGWGGEDDDIFRRIGASGLKVSRKPRLLCRYTMQVHKRDKTNPYNQKRRTILQRSWKEKDYKTEGLNTVDYQLLKIEFEPLFTRIQVQLPEPPVGVTSA